MTGIFGEPHPLDGVAEERRRQQAADIARNYAEMAKEESNFEREREEQTVSSEMIVRCDICGERITGANPAVDMAGESMGHIVKRGDEKILGYTIKFRYTALTGGDLPADTHICRTCDNREEIAYIKTLAEDLGLAVVKPRKPKKAEVTT